MRMTNVLLSKFSTFAMICFVCSLYSFAGAQDHSLSDKPYKAGLLDKIAGLIESKYVLPDKAQIYEDNFRKLYKSGCYDSCSNPKAFAEKITSDLIGITGDKHISLRVKEPGDTIEKVESPLRHPIRYHRLGIRENRGFSKLEWLDGNIGYLELRRFYLYPDVRDMVIASMKFLSHADAIIIDLRGNGGGSGDYLSSYFLAHPTQLTGWYSRADDFLTEFWTNGTIGIKPLVDVPLFLLTGGETFSAAESFAYDMKVRSRATIIGESTKGGAHSVDLFQIDDQFEIYIPTTRAVNPVSGTNWEGTGVVPDVSVPAESALDTAIMLARIKASEYQKTKVVELERAIDDMQSHIEQMEKLYRENEDQLASTALDSVIRIADTHGMLSEFFMYVLAYHYNSREDAQIRYAILKKRIEQFPDSPTAHEDLAYAFYRNNDNEAAIAAFRRVLEKNHGNRNAMNMINKILKE